MITRNAGLLERIIRFAIAHRWLMMALTAALVALGVWSFQRLPIDATPDITNVQVQINTEAPGYSPLEAEQRVTFPIETALAGLPRLDYTRSLSRYGLSQVTVVFEDGTDLYFARQQVAERLQQVASQLPPEVEPEMGPIATGLGEIFMYTVEADPAARRPDGTPFMQVNPEAAKFTAQAGDPTQTGLGTPGFDINEKPTNLPFVRGAVGYDSGQFYISYQDAPALNGKETIIGNVTSGLDVLEKLTLLNVRQKTGDADKITSVTVSVQ